jgi:hypothetical protein
MNTGGGEQLLQCTSDQDEGCGGFSAFSGPSHPDNGVWVASRLLSVDDDLQTMVDWFRVLQ